ncbi:peptidoglycan DD-metalloendopeptidase family protein [Siminovitchia sp. 179-K 8D1 HS]|uniref:peptidoglycan DD-metalloendopeptidase family protein n=1 Tax=Siminovitchia sp. 179-K 8D1 HS TaxID=3142385 RepID=UPI00399F96EF
MREEEKKRSSLKNFFKKRWVFPAIYLASAALLISMLFWYQSAGKNTADDQNLTKNSKNLTGMSGEDSVVEVNQAFENVAMPVKNEDEANIVTQFFDTKASTEEKEAALIVDGSTYRPNMGVDIAMKDGSEFEVVASLSGKVDSARQDPLLGNVIEIEHENGIKTIYQSVKDMKVKTGEHVKQGDVLATSGTSQFNKEAKTHVHFEIRKDNTALNPIDFFGQPFTAFEKVEKPADTSGETNNEVEEGTGDSEQEQTETGKELQPEKKETEE